MNKPFANPSEIELESTAILDSSAEIRASQLRSKHTEIEKTLKNIDGKTEVTIDDLSNVLKTLVNRFHDVNGLTAQLSMVNQSVKTGSMRSTRRFELEALQAGQVSFTTFSSMFSVGEGARGLVLNPKLIIHGQRCIVPSTYFDNYVPLVRRLCDPLYESTSSGRHEYYSLGILLSETLVAELNATSTNLASVSPVQSAHDAFLDSLTPPLCDDLFAMDIDMQPLVDLGLQNETAQMESAKEMTSASAPLTGQEAPESVDSNCSTGTSPNIATPTAGSSSPSVSPVQPEQQSKIETGNCCEICGYRPKGDPRWFHGSMQKHKKLQHSTAPPKIYKCPYPDCNSAYKNRPDNLRQHQIEKNHFVDGEDGAIRRPSKRKKISS